MSNASVHTGRHFLQIPGPTNVPDRILRAIDRPTIDHRGPEFGKLGLDVLTRIKQARDLFMASYRQVDAEVAGGQRDSALKRVQDETLPRLDELQVQTGALSKLQKKLADESGDAVVAEVRGKEREQSIAAEDLKALLPRFLAERLSRPPMVRKTLDHIVYIQRRSSVESKSEHVFPHRGRFLIKDFELSTRFPFGFFRHRRRLPARETELIVFPSPVPFDEKTKGISSDSAYSSA